MHGAVPIKGATTMKKGIMMAHNLQLLGFQPVDAVAAPSTRSTRTTISDNSSNSAVLHANMFDRPNEKMLFSILHFIVLKIHPQSEQELKFCWPIITPHDKSNFKRLVQTVLQDLEKQGVLPLGSSHASRLNAGSGPRIVDLVWRLSTHVIKSQLTRDFPSYQLVALPPRDGVDAVDAIQLLKARIAMKSRQLQEQFVARSMVQDQWVSFATTISAKIEQVSSLLQQVYSQQGQLDTSVNRDMFSQVGDVQRRTKLQNTNASWEMVHTTLTSATYQSSQDVLDTALQHHGDQPVLNGNQLRPQRSFSDRLGAVNLAEVVKNADTLIQLARSRLSQQDTSLQLSMHDQSRMARLTHECNSYMATLSSTLQQLRELLVEIQKSNDLAMRNLCIEMTTTMQDDSTTHASLALCPPTPADKVLHESDLVHSLKKCSMKELSSFAASSVRKSARKKSLELPSLHEELPMDDHGGDVVGAAPSEKPKAVEEYTVFRRLQYDLEEESGDHQMDL